MKIYVASRNQRVAQLIRDAVCAAGHEVIARWLDAPGYTGMPADESRRREVAIENVNDIRSADLLILRAEPDGSFVPGGKHVESGVALAMGLPVIVLGRPENVFHWHPLVTVVEDQESLLRHLRTARPSRGRHHQAERESCRCHSK